MPPGRPNSRRPRVFINCPFDEDYGDMLRAIAFAVAACGYEPARWMRATPGASASTS